MNVPIVRELTLDELKSKIETAYPTVNGNWGPGKNMLMIHEKDTKAAVMVLVKKNKVQLTNGFSSMGAQMGFMLFMLLLGIIIPAAIYVLVIKPKQDAIRVKVAEFIKSNYGQTSF